MKKLSRWGTPREDTVARLVNPTPATLARLAALRASTNVGFPPRILSFGGGVNSVATLLRDVREGTSPDVVILADTGEENPRTIAYFESYVVPFCDANEIPVVRAVSQKGRLVDYYRSRNSVPSITLRDCTKKFKVAVVRAVLRDLDIRAGVTVLGIAYDEVDRMRTSDVLWLRNEYPLIDRWKMGRPACEEEIASAGWPSPGKSGCRGCPFMGRKGAALLLVEDPEEFARWEGMEEGAIARNPRIRLVPRMRLRDLRDDAKRAAALAALDAQDGGECLAGVCAPAGGGAP